MTLAAAILLAGTVLVIAGVTLIYPAAGFLTAGAYLTLMARAIAAEANKPEREQ